MTLTRRHSLLHRPTTQLTLRLSWLSLVAVSLLFLVDPRLPAVVRYGPFLVSLVLFGLPHGAVDYLVPERVAGISRRRSMLAVGVLYLVCGGAYLAFWFVAPALAFVSFILLTWFHWGQGDLYSVLSFTDASHLPTRAERALAVVVRGGLPMLVPLLAFPATYREVAVAVVSLFDAPATTLDPFFLPSTRLALGVGFVLLCLLSVVLGGVRVRRNDTLRRPWLVDTGELALLWVFFVLVPPVLAVGLYFCLWHSLRHIARLTRFDPLARRNGTAERLDTPTALSRFARDATPLTLVSLVGFVGLFLLLPAPPAELTTASASTLTSLLGVYLVGIAALTLPHVVVVTWMDVREGVW